MSGFRRAAAALLAIAAVEAGASASTQSVSPAAIEACASALRAFEQSQSEQFDPADRCPALADSFPGSDTIGAQGARDLSAIVEGFRATADNGRDIDLDFDGLDALLDDVLVDRASEDSIWDRFLRWLEENFEDQESPRLGRLLEWLEGLDAPPWLGDVLIKASTVLIVLLALIVVGNELRLSGILRRRRRRGADRSRPVSAADTGRARAIVFDELRGLPPKALAGAIVEMVTAAFAERGWLSTSESLTNGELLGQLAEREKSIVRPFAALLNAVESIVYGDRVPDEEARRRLIASAGALLTHTRRASHPASRATQ